MCEIAAYFESLPNRLASADLRGVEATILFSFTGEGGSDWNLSLHDGIAETGQGAAAGPNVTITLAAEDFKAILAGKLGGQTAFLTGRLRIQGDMNLALKLQSLLRLG